MSPVVAANSVTVEAIPVAEAVQPHYEVAAQLFERALSTSGGKDPNIAYLLALAHKRQGKSQDARNAFRKIQKPDANVLLQMGLLSLQEGNLSQAEEEFARAWVMDPDSYEICYNLLLARLTLGKVEDSLNLIPRALELVTQVPANATLSGGSPADERRFLQMLQALLRCCAHDDVRISLDPILDDLTAAEEQRLLKVVLSLGQLDMVHTLLRALAEARPGSPALREAYVEAVLVKGKELIDRCGWTEAELLLRPLAKGWQHHAQCPAGAAQPARLLRLHDAGLRRRHAPLLRRAEAQRQRSARCTRTWPSAYELQGDMAKADPHWNRYFDLLDRRVPAPADMPHYIDAAGLRGPEPARRPVQRKGEVEQRRSATSQRAMPAIGPTIRRRWNGCSISTITPSAPGDARRAGAVAPAAARTIRRSSCTSWI